MTHKDKLALIDRIINAYHTTRPATVTAAEHILKNPRVQQAFDRFEEKPVIVANMSGGVLQGASANMPVDLYVLDFEDVDPWEAVEIEGSMATRMECGALVDPAFVAMVVEA